jgi:hypothetical protein
MSPEPEETLYPLTDLDDEDLWIRGHVYVRHKRLLAETEECTFDLERNVARARYEYEITQRIGSKLTDPQAQQDWKITESVAHDFIIMAEHELAEATKNAAYHRAMVTEMEADLGDKAQKYLEILIALEWVDEDWEEYLDEFDEFAGLEDEFGELDDEDSDLSDSIPF